MGPRIFTIATTGPKLVAAIHDRMPLILHSEDDDRWGMEPDPRDLMCPFPSELIQIWPIS